MAEIHSIEAARDMRAASRYAKEEALVIADAKAFAVLIKIQEQVKILADAFMDTGRSRVAHKLYESISMVVEAGEVLVQEKDGRTTQSAPGPTQPIA